MAPTRNEIGQLTAIVMPRTGLNCLLQQGIDKAVARGVVPAPPDTPALVIEGAFWG